MAESKSNLPHPLAAALRRHYRDVRVEVTRIERPEVSYIGWCICFEAAHKEALLATGLFPPICFDPAHLELWGPEVRDEWGNKLYARHNTTAQEPYWSAVILVPDFELNWSPTMQRRLNSQKLRKQVDRLLRPFIKGTWQPRATGEA